MRNVASDRMNTIFMINRIILLIGKILAILSNLFPRPTHQPRDLCN